MPVPSQCPVYYFEIEVLDQGEFGSIAIGFAEKRFKLTQMPGWQPLSYGYHGDDGCKFGGIKGAKGVPYGPLYGAGDTVGAGIHLGKQKIFFTRNGVKLPTASRNVCCDNLYPTIELFSKNETIQANFGRQPFKFDLKMLELRSHVSAAGDAQFQSMCADFVKEQKECRRQRSRMDELAARTKAAEEAQQQLTARTKAAEAAQQQLSRRVQCMCGHEEALSLQSLESLMFLTAELEGALPRIRNAIVEKRVQAARHEVSEAAQCAVCLDKQRDTSLTCGHLMCRACSDAVTACPICRAPITSRARVFL